MIGCLPTSARKQPIIALYFESETILKFYNSKAGFGREEGTQGVSLSSNWITHKMENKRKVTVMQVKL